MKILVTGAYGQLGKEIAGKTESYPEAEFIFTDVDTLDITSENEVNRFFLKHNPGYVVNCAAYTAVDKAELEVESAEKVNALAPAILAKNAKNTGAKFIHISTDYVFDGKGHLPYSEEDNVNPQNEYGKSKLQGEINVLKENQGAIILRTSWLYSAFGNNFVKTMLKLAAERDSLKVVFDQVGTPTYAADLASVILKIIQLSEENSNNFIPGIYHYSNEGVTSWFDFAKTIFEITGTDCRVSPVLSEEFPTPAQRPSFSVLNKSKIKDNFKVEIPYWKDSLKFCIEKLKNI